MDGISRALALGAPAAPRERYTPADSDVRDRAGRVLVADELSAEVDRDGGLYAFAVAQTQQRQRVMDALSVTLRAPPSEAQTPNRDDVVRLSADGRAAADDAVVASLYPTRAGAQSRGAQALEGLGDREASAIEEDGSDEDEAVSAANDEEEVVGLDPAPAGDAPATDETGAIGPNAPRGDEEAKPETRPTATQGELTPDEQREVAALAERDREVRTHEQAHKATGGRYAGAVSLSYTTGPDGRRYANSGVVPVDLSRVSGDPMATVQKLEQVKRAALAPADPSGADRRIAARAAQGAQRARMEVLAEALEKSSTAERPDAALETKEIAATKDAEIEKTRPISTQGGEGAPATPVEQGDAAPAIRSEGTLTARSEAETETTRPTSIKRGEEAPATPVERRDAAPAPRTVGTLAARSEAETAPSDGPVAKRAPYVPEDPPRPMAPDVQPMTKLRVNVYA